MAVSLITIEERYGAKTAIFSMPLAGREPVFMCVVETPYENEHRGVVMVDARKLLKLWRASPEGLAAGYSAGESANLASGQKIHLCGRGLFRGFGKPRATGAGGVR
jgi:hypothetical protein